MRLRNIPGAKEEICRNSCVASDPKSCRGNWDRVFAGRSAGREKDPADARPGKKPLYIEVGMGKGRFLMELSRLHPDNNYVGMEMYDSVLLRAVQKKNELQENGVLLDNCLFIREDARLLPELFAPGEAAGIYLNFSDPWPKARHAKRRLTSHQFLERYEKILAPGGRIEFKTDNRELFDFSLQEAGIAGWTVEAFTYDLHHDGDLLPGNVMTEYEEKFCAMGKPIAKMILSKK